MKVQRTNTKRTRCHLCGCRSPRLHSPAIIFELNEPYRRTSLHNAALYAVAHVSRSVAMAFISPLSLRPPLARTRQHSVVRRTVARGARRRRVCASAAGEVENEAAASALNSLLGAVRGMGDAVAELLYTPVSSCSVLSGRWERVAGSYVLRPTVTTPRAVIHFLGGAFVGAAPHVAYRTLLERLCNCGYAIVATPYDLSLDYMDLVARVADTWEQVEAALALEYGALPVVGLGHSAGAVFHALASALFAETCANAANVLVSFNNKAASDAIPAYESIFAPAFRAIVAVEQNVPDDIRDALARVPQTLDEAVTKSQITPARVRDNLLPLLRDSKRVLEQVAPLIREIGAVPRESASDDAPRDLPEFYPAPSDVRASIEMMYSVPQTLVVRFANDSIDESAALEEMVRTRQSKDQDVEVTLVELPGTHVTPLAQDVPRPVEPAAMNFMGGAAGAGAWDVAATALQTVADVAGGNDMRGLEKVVDQWISAGIANGYL